MANRRRLIAQTDSLLKECSENVSNLLEFQNMKQNDARVTFFKHMNNILNSTTLSLILAYKYLGRSNLAAIHKEFFLSPRLYDYDTEMKYFDQMVMNDYFLFIFNTFEHAIRLIYREYNKGSQKLQDNFNGICKEITKDLGLKKRDDFIDLITYLRNSFHNNGLFVPKGNQKRRSIQWNGTIYYFNENRQISESKNDMWLSFVPISKEIISFFNEIINSDKVKKLNYYPDATEPIR